MQKGSQAGDSFIQCDTCDLWYHNQCSGLPPDLIPQLNSTKAKYFLFRWAVSVQKRNLHLSTRKAIEGSIEDSLPTLLVTIVKETMKHTTPTEVYQSNPYVPPKNSETVDQNLELRIQSVPESAETNFAKCLEHDDREIENILILMGEWNPSVVCCAATW